MIKRNRNALQKSSVLLSLGVICRYALYTLLLGCSAALLPQLVGRFGINGFFAERGPVEIAQVLLLVAMIFLYLAFARTYPCWCELSYILAMLSAFALLRELDFALDHTIPIVGWKIAGILPLVIAILLYRKWSGICLQITEFTRTRAFSLLWAGLMTVMIIAQLLGTTSLFQAMMGDAYNRIYKRIIEESGELMGYLILLFGTIEYGVCCQITERTENTVLIGAQPAPTSLQNTDTPL
jgi:hypothetical protein